MGSYKHKNQYSSYNLQIIEGKNSIHTSKKIIKPKTLNKFNKNLV